MEKRFNIYEMIDEIRNRGIGMFVGQASLTYLVMFLQGCSTIAGRFGVKEDEQPPFYDFHSWTAKRLKVSMGGKGYWKMILERVNGDEELGLEMFYQFLDEYRKTSKKKKKRTPAK